MDNNIGKLHQAQKLKTHVLLCAGMIIPAAALFSITADLPHVLVLTVIGALGSLTISTPVKYSDRSVIYSLVVAAVLAVIFDLVFPMDEERFSILGGIAQANISVPFLLYLAICITLFESSAHVLGLCACFSLAVVLLGGDIYMININNVRFPFLPEKLKNIYTLYPLVVTIEILFMLIALQVARPACSPDAHNRKGYKLKKIIVLMSALVLTITVATTGLSLFRKYEAELRQLEYLLMRFGMHRRQRTSRIVFSSKVNLNRTLSDNVRENQKKIVLRARGDTPPGYLRGRVYTDYKRGNWTNPNTEKTNFDSTTPGGILAYKTFYYLKESSSKYDFHVFPASGFYSDVLLVPGNSQKFELVAERLGYTINGIIKPEDWEKDGGYTVSVSKPEEDSAYPFPEEKLKSYLAISDDLAKALTNFINSNNELKEIIAIQKSRPDDDKFIVALVRFFQKNYSYSLDFKPEAGTDPVLDFLKRTGSGHCELFATAMTLLLRKNNIPARYVTGFICAEPHPSGNYYVARLGNAHAWLEAYLPSEKKWILVEPTPASGVPNFSHEWGMFESWSDQFSQLVQRILADMRRGYFAKAIIAVFGGLFSIIWRFLMHPVRGPAVLLLLIVYWYYRKWKHAKTGSGRLHSYSDEMVELRREYSALEAIINRKYGFIRSPQATIGEWCEQLTQRSESFSRKLIDLLNKYQSMRYRKQSPSRQEIDEFKNRVHDLKKTR